MKVKTLQDYITRCKLEQRVPEVYLGGVRFLIESSIDEEPTFSLFTCLNTALVDNQLHWEYYSTGDGEKLRAVPISRLVKDIPETVPCSAS